MSLDNNVMNDNGVSKSALIRAELDKGNFRAADIRSALASQGVEVKDGLIHMVKSKWRATNAQPTGVDGVVRLRRASVEQEGMTPTHRGGTKKEAILKLYHDGVTKASDIKRALEAQGVTTSANNIYVVLNEVKGTISPSRVSAPARKVEPVAAQAKAPTPKKEPLIDAGGVNPRLALALQAMALEYGIRDVRTAFHTVESRAHEVMNSFRTA
jgi:hypothetical protein